MTIWNLLDYPSVIVPVTQVESGDQKDPTYKPINQRDREDHEMYDPELFVGMPESLQLVGQTLQEEKLLAVAAAIDQVIAT